MSRHVPFDGGSLVPYRTAIRDAVVERLAPLLKSNGAFIPAIRKLPGRIERFDKDSSAQMFKELLGQAPSICVAIGDRTGQPNGIGGFKHLTFLDVHIYFVHNSMRSLVSRVESDIYSTGDEDLPAHPSADPGVDVAMQCVEELLVGQQPERPAPNPPAAPSKEHGPGVIRHLEFKREENLITDNSVTIWEQVYAVGVSRSIDRTRGVLAKLLSIATNLHPSGGEEAPAPARVEFETVIEEAPP